MLLRIFYPRELNEFESRSNPELSRSSSRIVNISVFIDFKRKFVMIITEYEICIAS